MITISPDLRGLRVKISVGALAPTQGVRTVKLVAKSLLAGWGAVEYPRGTVSLLLSAASASGTDSSRIAESLPLTWRLAARVDL